MKSFFEHFVLLLLGVTCVPACRTASTNVALQQPQTAVRAQPVDGWRVFTAPDKSFLVELPCEPTQINVSEPTTPIYEYRCMVQDKDGLSFFTASATNIDDRKRARMQDEAEFDRTIRELFPAHKRITKLTRLNVDNGMGREFVITNTRDDMDNLRGRMILVGRRQYWVVFVSTDLKALDSLNAERFLASFKALQ